MERDQHTYNTCTCTCACMYMYIHVYMYDATVHCRATHYITATAIHYCVDRSKRRDVEREDERASNCVTHKPCL